MQRRKLIVVTMAAVIATALAGCSAGSGGSKGAYTAMIIESQSGTGGIDQTAPLAAEAAAKAINAAGGINGKQLNVVLCDPASDPNKSIQCARTAVSNKDIAVVGSFDLEGVAGLLPVLQSAKIPYLGSLAVLPQEFTNPDSFPISSAAPGGNFGTVPLMKKAGCTTVGDWGDPSSDGGLSAALNAAIEKDGMKVSFAVLSVTTTDVTPAVSEVLSKNPDCLALATRGQAAVQVFKAARAAGSKAKLISADAAMTPPFLQALGSASNGMILAADEPLPTDPAVSAYRSQLKKYAPSVKQLGEFSLNAWYAVQVLDQALKGMSGTVTSAGLLSHLETMKNIKLPGMATFSFDKSPTANTIYPRMFNPTVIGITVKNGQAAAGDTTWTSLTSALPEK
jgi:branched-chain amino acid transport system substrate-binding protein